jgi:hypothetical protein
LYGCDTWTLTLREEHRSREFQNGVPRRMFAAKTERKWQKDGENYTMKSFITVLFTKY